MLQLRVLAPNEMTDEVVRILDHQRGRDRAATRDPVIYTPDRWSFILARIAATDDLATAFVGEFGPVMVVHTGPGLAGLAWWWEQQS